MVLLYGGFYEANDPQVLQNRVCQYYLGVHKFTPVPATQILMDWPDMKALISTEIIRNRNGLAKMTADRLPVKLYKLEKSIRIEVWVKNMELILRYCSMPECTCNVHL